MSVTVNFTLRFLLAYTHTLQDSLDRSWERLARPVFSLYVARPGSQIRDSVSVQFLTENSKIDSNLQKLDSIRVNFHIRLRSCYSCVSAGSFCS